MNKIQIVKTTLHYAADFGSCAIVAGIVAQNVPRNNIFTKVTVPVAGFMLGNVVGRIAAKEMDRTVDEAIETVKKIKDKKTETD